MKAEHIKSIEEGNSSKFYKSSAWLNKRLDILDRDNYECQRCKELGKLSIRQQNTLEVHHIKFLEDKPKLGLEDSNLIAVCKECHNYYHNRFGSQKKSKVLEGHVERW